MYGYRQNEQDRCCRRVAILDFDIHHGNGTEAIVKRLAKQYPNQIFFCSIHLYDHSSNSRYSFYPGTGKNDNMESNIVNIALPPMWHNASLVSSSPSGLPPPPSVPSGRRAFRKEIMSRLIPALRAYVLRGCRFIYITVSLSLSIQHRLPNHLKNIVNSKGSLPILS